MGFTEFEAARIKVEMDKFMEEKRPPAHIRPELDILYKLDRQSIIIFERRPHWQDSTKFMDGEVAKLTYVRTQDVWKLYWMKRDLKWHLYEPDPEFDNLEDGLKVVDMDEYCAFWG